MKGFLIPSCLLWDNLGQKVVGLWKKINRKDGNMKNNSNFVGTNNQQNGYGKIRSSHLFSVLLIHHLMYAIS